MTINSGVNVKNWVIRVSVMMNLFGIQACVNVNSSDVGEYLDYANCKCRKRLIEKLLLKCEDKLLDAVLLNSADTISITDKNVSPKNSYLIYIISLAIISLILLDIG